MPREVNIQPELSIIDTIANSLTNHILNELHIMDESTIHQVPSSDEMDATMFRVLNDLEEKVSSLLLKKVEEVEAYNMAITGKKNWWDD